MTSARLLPAPLGLLSPLGMLWLLGLLSVLGGCAGSGVVPGEATDFLHAQVSEVFRSTVEPVADARIHGKVAGMLERFLRRKGFSRIESADIPGVFNVKVAEFDAMEQAEVYYLGSWQDSDEFVVLLRHTLQKGSQVSGRVFWFATKKRFSEQQEAVNRFTSTLSGWWAGNDPFRRPLRHSGS